MARRGENIRKRKDGRWEGRYIKGHTSEGKVRWGYVYGTSYAEVRSKTIQKRAEYGLYNLTSQATTFRELAELWLCSLRQGVKESTFAHYQYTLHHYLFPVFADFMLDALNEKVLEQGLISIITPSEQNRRPLGSALAQECLTMLRRICKYAQHLHLLRPVEIMVKLPQKKPTFTKVLSKDDMKKLKAFVLESPTPRKLGLLFGTQMGLRIGEICGLQWGDFDFSAGTVTIHRTVSRISCGDGHTKIVIQSPKTKNSARKLPIPSVLLRTLKQLRGRFSNETWFLSGSEERPVEPRCYRKSIHAYLKHGSINQVHPHALRHSFATICLQMGCDIKTLSELLGHANAAVTLKRYVHSDINRKSQEINRIFRD